MQSPDKRSGTFATTDRKLAAMTADASMMMATGEGTLDRKQPGALE